MNTYKAKETNPGSEAENPIPPNPKSKPSKFALRVQRLLNGEFLTHEGLIKHLPFISFLAGLFLLHIALMYFYESTEREIVKSEKALKELNADYKTAASVLELRSQQSQVAIDIEKLGLIEVRTPSTIIDVEEGFLPEEN